MKLYSKQTSRILRQNENEFNTGKIVPNFLEIFVFLKKYDYDIQDSHKTDENINDFSLYFQSIKTHHLISFVIQKYSECIYKKNLL